MCVFKCKLLRITRYYYSVLLCVTLGEVPRIKNLILKKQNLFSLYTCGFSKTNYSQFCSAIWPAINKCMFIISKALLPAGQQLFLGIQENVL